MSKLKVALIGNGGICRACHIEKYYENDRIEVVAFCDIIEEKAIKLRDKYSLLQQCKFKMKFAH